jgi:iron complex transport system substrate-binding protein
VKKTTVAATAIIITLIIVASSYGVYTLYVPSENGSQKETVTVVDKTGVSVEVKVPVERIVNIAPGAVEIICALGCGDKIVGRDTYSTFPPSMSEIPIVGESSFSPNLELLLELQPDLVIADEGLDAENQKKIEDAGVPVIIEMFMEPRLTTCIGNLGLILDAEEKATELIDFYEYYENLVSERIKDVASTEKPSFYFEWYMPWYSTRPGDSWDELLVAAGGTNIAPEGPISDPQLSPEFVAEQNPDVIVRMLTRMDGEDMAAFQALRDEILNRPALSETTAVKEEKVFVIKNTVLVLRRPIGLLYLAKWFHPSLFEDIDPAAIHEQMIQKFFGVELEGVFAYP